MIRTVICVLILVLYGIQAKVILNDEKLLDDSTNFIHKDETKNNIEEHVDLPTYKAETKEINITEKFPKEPLLVNVSSEDTSNINKNEIKCDETKDSVENLLDTLLNSDERDACGDKSRHDNTALILTPLIDDGKIEEARTSSKVNSDMFLGVESYSGFLTVNKTYNSNLFFWYFPVQNKTVNDTPWMIWLQGGPGATSLTGLFDEIGPFRVNFQYKLVKNNFTWLRNHSLLFIDNPVGTGYSFTNHKDGFAQDMATYSSHLHTALQQFLQVFPELRKAPLYVAGESYAGKYVPALATEIHKRKDVPELNINLQGLLMGNAYVDPEMISRMPLMSYYMGLLDKEELNILDPIVTSFQRDIKEKNSIHAKEQWNNLIVSLLQLTYQRHGYNYLKDDILVGRFANFLYAPEVRRAIHVGNIKFSFINITVNEKMAPDFLSSSKGMCEELLEHYRILVYCGHLDQMLPCMYLSENYRTWNWTGSKEFLIANRLPYSFNSKLAGLTVVLNEMNFYNWISILIMPLVGTTGILLHTSDPPRLGMGYLDMNVVYQKSGGNLTEVVFRGAGHMVPMDAPAAAQKLITNWTHKKPLSEINKNMININSFVKDFIRNNTNIYL